MEEAEKSGNEIPGTVEGEGLAGLQPYHFYCCYNLFSRTPVDLDKIWIVLLESNIGQ